MVVSRHAYPGPMKFMERFLKGVSIIERVCPYDCVVVAGMSRDFQCHESHMGDEGVVPVDMPSHLHEAVMVELADDHPDFNELAELGQVVQALLCLPEAPDRADDSVVDGVDVGMERDSDLDAGIDACEPFREIELAEALAVRQHYQAGLRVLLATPGQNFKQPVAAQRRLAAGQANFSGEIGCGQLKNISGGLYLTSIERLRRLWAHQTTTVARLRQQKRVVAAFCLPQEADVAIGSDGDDIAFWNAFKAVHGDMWRKEWNGRREGNFGNDSRVADVRELSLPSGEDGVATFSAREPVSGDPAHHGLSGG